MAKFLDKSGSEWLVDLDVLKIEEIERDHGVRLTNLEKDPLLSCRNDPAILAAMILVICREQRERLAITREQFIRLLPSPPDPMLEAMTEAIVSFFPSGRHLHVREVLTRMEEMAAKTDEIAAQKLAIVISDPQIIEKLKRKADRVFGEEVAKHLA